MDVQKLCLSFAEYVKSNEPPVLYSINVNNNNTRRRL